MKKTIAIKFISIVALLTVTIMTSLTVVCIYTADKSLSEQASAFIEALKKEQANEEELLKNALLMKGESITTLLVQNGASLIIGYDFDTLGQLAQSGANDPDIAFVTFYDKECEIPFTEEMTGAADMETIKKEIYFEDDLIGFVILGLDYTSAENSVSKGSERIETIISDTAKTKTDAIKLIIMLIIAVSLTGVFVLCIAIFVLLRFVVTKPISKVVDLAKGISEGNLTSTLGES